MFGKWQNYDIRQKWFQKVGQMNRIRKNRRTNLKSEAWEVARPDHEILGSELKRSRPAVSDFSDFCRSIITKVTDDGNTVLLKARAANLESI